MAGGADAYCQYLQSITAESVIALDQHVSAKVHFKDPFNDVHGIDSMRAVFIDMFENISDISFDIHDQMSEGNTTIITWTMSGILMKKPWSVDGASRLTFDDGGFLTEHLDYWDAAAGLYEKLPFIGWLPRALRRKLSIQP